MPSEGEAVDACEAVLRAVESGEGEDEEDEPDEAEREWDRELDFLDRSNIDLDVFILDRKDPSHGLTLQRQRVQFDSLLQDVESIHVRSAQGCE